LTTPIPINSARPLILVLSYSYLLPIMPDKERQNNWTNSTMREEAFASAIDAAYGCGNPNINHD
jgi:hypothetical protein